MQNFDNFDVEELTIGNFKQSYVFNPKKKVTPTINFYNIQISNRFEHNMGIDVMGGYGCENIHEIFESFLLDSTDFQNYRNMDLMIQRKVGQFVINKTSINSLGGLYYDIDMCKLVKNYYLRSFTNVHKQLLGDIVNLHLDNQIIESHMLGLLRCKLGNLSYSFDPTDGNDHIKNDIVNKVTNAYDILSSHLMGDRDVMECHESLTRAGLKEYAKF